MGSRRHQLPCLARGGGALLGMFALAVAAPAQAVDCTTGMFVAAAGPDMASALELNKDGSFRYMLSEGAVDESADGRWTCDNGTLILHTTPRPKAPQFSLGKVEHDVRAPFSLLVTWPNGRGIAGVDFVLELDSGEPITDYTQSYGWAGDLNGRKPLSLRVSEPFYGTASPLFPLEDDDHQQIEIILTPNDMGTADFRNTLVTQEGNGLVLHWRGRAIPYVPAIND